MPLRLAVLTLVLCINGCALHKNHKLSLIKAYEVQTQGYLEPSGLTYWDGEFYTVSDKQDKIYRLKFGGDSVELEPLISINNNRQTKLDFEGITHDETFFYLISEKYFQILRVSKDGSQQRWLPADSNLQAVGQGAGLFQTHNANFEGLCILQNENVGPRFLMAAERQPRGFIEADLQFKSIKAYQSQASAHDYENGRSPDFTGLSCDNGLYVLVRNAHKVAQLVNDQGHFTEGTAFSYYDIINQPKFRYQDMQYGHAEGLVVKGDRVYIILDNNRNPHQLNPSNNNSLFLILQK
jgi:uncharacterized protein YjiK